MPNFKGNEDLCKLGKEYLNDLLCKFGPFCLQHLKTFDLSRAVLQVTIAEFNAQTGPVFFLAHPVHCKICYHITNSSLNYRLKVSKLCNGKSQNNVKSNITLNYYQSPSFLLALSEHL